MTIDSTIEINRPLLASIVRKYGDDDELRAAGLVGLWRAARAQPTGGAFSTLATLCIRGEIVDYKRWWCAWDRAAKRPRYHPVTLPDNRASAGGPFEEIERQDYVRFLLGHLDARARAVVERRHLQGESMERIAADLGVSPSRASQICTAALARMRRAA